ncbi:cob(I)yrinic acid a,c-diamide adenosyltransferase [Patescibacteria group bacterium]|nr:MAG: cob(I)yrinic acid a,c-diamide adenosyltransferase [Patescibacteria group bacterium]
MKIYTKTGDTGETSLLGGKRVSKSCVEMKVVGEIDELNAALGLAVSHCHSDHDVTSGEESLVLIIKDIQRDLFKLGAEIASAQTVIATRPEAGKQSRTISGEETKKLETKIDQLWPQMPELKNFILPGGCETAARLHLARAICRRAERELVAFGQKKKIRTALYRYFNRLSDFLFTAARWANHQNGITEEPR